MEIGAQKDALYLRTQAVMVQKQGLRYAQERNHVTDTVRAASAFANLGSTPIC